MRFGLGFGIDVNSVALRQGADVSFNGPMLALPASLQRLGFTYTRNSAKTVYQNNALVTLAANQFGTTYDSVTGLYGYEPEPAATNLALNSAGAAATWLVSSVTDAGTPISGFAASLAFGDNSVARSAYKSIPAATDGITYTCSAFIQMDDGGAPVVGATSVLGDFSIVAEAAIASTNITVSRLGSSSVYRVSASRTATAPIFDSFGIIKYTTQSARTFRVIGIQVETGSRATSYIATDGSTRTRAADVLSTALTNVPGFNPAGYTLVADYRRDIALLGLGGYMLAVHDGSANNLAATLLNSASNTQTYIGSGGVQQSDTIETTVGTARNKIAFSVKANSFLRAINGVAGTADMTGAMPVAPTTFTVGASATSTLQFNGYIYGFKLITTALNQEQSTGQTT